MQPMIEPLFAGRSRHELLAEVAPAVRGTTALSCELLTRCQPFPSFGGRKNHDAFPGVWRKMVRVAGDEHAIRGVKGCFKERKIVDVWE